MPKLQSEKSFGTGCTLCANLTFNSASLEAYRYELLNSTAQSLLTVLKAPYSRTVHCILVYLYARGLFASISYTCICNSLKLKLMPKRCSAYLQIHVLGSRACLECRPSSVRRAHWACKLPLVVLNRRQDLPAERNPS